jgi:hypothetical protein
MSCRALLAALFVTLASAGSSFAADMAHCAKVLYVSVTAHGAVKVDGILVSQADLDQTLSRLKPSVRLVFYYRENSQIEPGSDDSQKIRRIFDTVMKLRLPISLSSKADFSDSVDENGLSKPWDSCPNLG